MDPVTHAASGMVAILALPSRPATAWSVLLAGAACAAPDLDLLFIHTPLQFLQIHRGISHSFAFMPFFALLLAICCYPLWRKATKDHWTFFQIWLLCCAMILLHIWLDVCTTYGTMVFLPFSHYRVRLNSIYIIDLLVTLPLFWAVLRWRSRRVAALALCWTFIFPATGIALNHWHTGQAFAMFKAENRQVERLHVLPDAFAPFFWRLIFEEITADGPTVRSMGLDFMGRPRTTETVRTGAEGAMLASYMKQSIACDTYFNFAMLPVMEKLRPADEPEDMEPDAKALMFYDLRFGSSLEFVRKLLAMRPNADIPFLLMTVSAQDFEKPDSLESIRLRFSDSGRDSRWHKPDKPKKPDWLQWLLGLR